MKKTKVYMFGFSMLLICAFCLPNVKASDGLANGDVLIYDLGEIPEGQESYDIIGGAKFVISDIDEDPVSGQAQFYHIDSDELDNANSDFVVAFDSISLSALWLLGYTEDVDFRINDVVLDCTKITIESEGTTLIYIVEDDYNLVIQLTIDDGTTMNVMKLVNISSEDVDLRELYGASGIPGFPLGIVALISVIAIFGLVKKIRK